MTALGDFAGAEAVLDVQLTSGGVFNQEEPQVEQANGYGTFTLTMVDCNSLKLAYSFPGLGLTGEIDLVRVVPDNAALCEDLQ